MCLGLSPFLQLLSLWRKVWNVMEDEKMEVLRGDKVPLEVPLMEKLYLRHDLALFKTSSLLDLYAHILERLSRLSSALR